MREMTNDLDLCNDIITYLKSISTTYTIKQVIKSFNSNINDFPLITVEVSSLPKYVINNVITHKKLQLELTIFANDLKIGTSFTQANEIVLKLSDEIKESILSHYGMTIVQVSPVMRIADKTNVVMLVLRFEGILGKDNYIYK